MFIDKSLKNEINKLLEVKQINMNIADMLLQLFPYEDAISKISVNKAKEKGLVRQEGKEYVMQDGDICHFRFNV